MPVDSSNYLIVPLLQGFEWFDESLQQSLRARGWPQLTQPQSSVMIHVILGVNRPSAIARSMGLSRQAVHVTIKQVVKKGIFDLLDDPQDKRSKIIVLTAMGQAMRRDAQATIQYLMDQLAQRIGQRYVDGLRAAFTRDWGPPIVCPVDEGQRPAAQAARKPARKSARRSDPQQPATRQRTAARR
ncbi:MAG: MarR family transcriptional regulator [Gammaproteobacteria bacterium]|nr:MarR family transcriptional regulator [Gammaproteobacteria bacterium]